MLFRYLNDDEFRDFYSKNAYEDGHEDGRSEATLATAKKMKAKGFDLETICDITGLSGEEIKAL